MVPVPRITLYQYCCHFLLVWPVHTMSSSNAKPAKCQAQPKYVNLALEILLPFQNASTEVFIEAINCSAQGMCASLLERNVYSLALRLQLENLDQHPQLASGGPKSESAFWLAMMGRWYVFQKDVHLVSRFFLPHYQTGVRKGMESVEVEEIHVGAFLCSHFGATSRTNMD